MTITTIVATDSTASVRTREFAWSLVSIVAAALLLASPAVWNGFPLLYWDSADYIAMPFTGEVPVFRTVSYVLITALAAPTGTLWTVIAIQSLLVSYLLHEVLAALAPMRNPSRALVPAAAGLTVFTALPWFTAQLMADTFTGVLVLGLAALAFSGDRLRSGRRLALAATLGLATAVHTTHVALGGGLVLVFLALRGLALLGRLRWLAPRVLLPGGALALGIVLAVSANWAMTGRAVLSQSTSSLMLARLVQDGIAKKYLDEVCPQGAQLRMCAVRGRLPGTANSFLWFPGPFYEIGGWTRAVQKEAAFIVRDSLHRFPLEHVASAIELTREQLAMIETGDGVVNMDTIHANDSIEKNPFIPKLIRQYYPDDLPAYMASEQRHAIKFQWINAIQVPVAVFGILAAVVVLGLALRRRDRIAAGLALTVVLAILGNAFVCGALSNPNHRYQARVVWAALVAVGIGAACLRRPERLVLQQPR